MRDVTDAGKHRGLGRLPEVTEAKPRTVEVASLPLLLNSAKTVVYTLVLSDGSHEDFGKVLERVVAYWQAEFSEAALHSPYG